MSRPSCGNPNAAPSKSEDNESEATVEPPSNGLRIRCSLRPALSRRKLRLSLPPEAPAAGWQLHAHVRQRPFCWTIELGTASVFDAHPRWRDCPSIRWDSHWSLCTCVLENTFSTRLCWSVS